MKKIHFGITVLSGEQGFYLNAENYAIKSNKSSFHKKMSCAEYVDEYYKFYTDDFVIRYYKAIMENYYLNMNYFSRLDRGRFQQEVSDFVSRNKFIEVNDLNDYTNMNGYYVMVLDE